VNLDRHPTVVAVTGAAHGIGPALTRALAASSQIRRIIAIDDKRSDSNGVTWRIADVRDPALVGRLTGVDVIVHADINLTPDSDPRHRRAYNIRGAQTVLTAAAAGRVGRVVLVTSAMVYGAWPGNPVPLAETAPLAAQTDGSMAGDMLEIERLALRSLRINPGMALTVVRPAALVGDGVDMLATRHFATPRLPTAEGCPPRWQFCHVEDLVSALEFTVARRIGGEFAVGCDGWLEQDEVEGLSGLKSIELPARLTFGAAQRLHQMGVTPASAMDLRFVTYPWVVDCAMLRAAGWRPRFSNAEALNVLLSQRSHRPASTGRRGACKRTAMTVAGA
jgi:nucleoside-diphosphate-sugar epimerase